MSSCLGGVGGGVITGLYAFDSHFTVGILVCCNCYLQWSDSRTLVKVSALVTVGAGTYSVKKYHERVCESAHRFVSPPRVDLYH